MPGFKQVIVEAFLPGNPSGVIVEYAVILDTSSTTTVTENTIMEVVQANTNNAGFLGVSSLKLTPTLVATGKNL